MTGCDGYDEGIRRCEKTLQQLGLGSTIIEVVDNCREDNAVTCVFRTTDLPTLRRLTPATIPRKVKRAQDLKERLSALFHVATAVSNSWEQHGDVDVALFAALRDAADAAATPTLVDRLRELWANTKEETVRMHLDSYDNPDDAIYNLICTLIGQRNDARQQALSDAVAAIGELQ